jgi:hypothetical protein
MFRTSEFLILLGIGYWVLGIETQVISKPKTQHNKIEKYQHIVYLI